MAPSSSPVSPTTIVQRSCGGGDNTVVAAAPSTPTKATAATTTTKTTTGLSSDKRGSYLKSPTSIIFHDEDYQRREQARAQARAMMEQHRHRANSTTTTTNNGQGQSQQQQSSNSSSNSRVQQQQDLQQAMGDMPLTTTTTTTTTIFKTTTILPKSPGKKEEEKEVQEDNDKEQEREEEEWIPRPTRARALEAQRQEEMAQQPLAALLSQQQLVSSSEECQDDAIDDDNEENEEEEEFNPPMRAQAFGIERQEELAQQQRLAALSQQLVPPPEDEEEEVEYDEEEEEEEFSRQTRARAASEVQRQEELSQQLAALSQLVPPPEDEEEDKDEKEYEDDNDKEEEEWNRHTKARAASEVQRQEELAQQMAALSKFLTTSDGDDNDDESYNDNYDDHENDDDLELESLHRERVQAPMVVVPTDHPLSLDESTTFFMEPSRASSDRPDSGSAVIPEERIGSVNTKKLLRELELVELRQKTLERQLFQNGLTVAEEIPYPVAKAKIEELSNSMRTFNFDEDDDEDNGGSGGEEEVDQAELLLQYYELEEELEKYSAALMLTDEWAYEQAEREEQWERNVQAENMAALQSIRRHMPVHVRFMTNEELTTRPTPNGKFLPEPMVRKFKRTNILTLIRMHPDAIERMHPSLMEGLRTTGLTLVERRALYEHLRTVGTKWKKTAHVDKITERKWKWHESLTTKFKECLTVESLDSKGIDYSDDYGYTIQEEYEPWDAPTSNADESPLASSGSMTLASSYRPKTGRGGNKMSDSEVLAMVSQRVGIKNRLTDSEEQLLKELVQAEKRSQSMEHQLVLAGITIVKEKIPYLVAKEKLQELTMDMKSVMGNMGKNTSNSKEVAQQLEKEYMDLSRELQTYTNAVMLTKEWAAEQEDNRRQWEARVQDENRKALQQLRRHMPVGIHEMSEEYLSKEPTPNGKLLPLEMCRKFQRTNILLLLRRNPADIEPMHPSSLEALRTTGLTLTERRALYEHLKELGPKWKVLANSRDKMAERKWAWYDSLKKKFIELLENYEAHVDQYGPPQNHLASSAKTTITQQCHGVRGGGVTPSARATGCPMIGNQCPCRANLVLDYSGDYGFPIEDIYSTTTVQKSTLLSVEDLIARNAVRGNAAGVGGLMAAISSRR
jgi:hypothetical protein